MKNHENQALFAWLSPLNDIVGELVSQAQIRNTLFFIASSIYDFANNILMWLYQSMTSEKKEWQEEFEAFHARFAGLFEGSKSHV